MAALVPSSRDRHRDRVTGVNERARIERRRFAPRPGPLRNYGSTIVGGLEPPIAQQIPGAAEHGETIRQRSVELARERGHLRS